MLKRRLERLEESRNQLALVVIVDCYIGPSVWLEPVRDYQIGDKQMYRKAGESNEELESRAEIASRAQASKGTHVLVLEPIRKEDLCEA